MEVDAVSRRTAKLSLDRLMPRAKAAESSFKGILRETAETSPEYVVQRGDSLWRICRGYLGQSGDSVPASEVSDAVGQVARANGLRNANVITPGQRLDLSVLESGADHAPAVGVVRSEGSALGRGGLAPQGTAGKDLTGMLQALIEGGKTADAAPSAVSERKSWGGLLGGSAWLSSKFGMRRDPFTGRRAHHDGVDLAAPSGTEVYSLEPGVVTFSGWKGGYGRAVMVRHADGEETVYGHLSKSLVKAGDPTSGEAPLGLVGSSGRSTGPHLHFELRRDGRSVDPLPLLLGQHTRLAAYSR